MLRQVMIWSAKTAKSTACSSYLETLSQERDIAKN